MPSTRSSAERALRIYWKIMNAGLSSQTLTEYQDDLEDLSVQAESPVLREACLRNMRRFDHLGSTRRVAIL